MRNRNIFILLRPIIPMVSKYDVFYVIATKGTIKVSEIVGALNKPKEEYNNVYNNVLELEKEGHIKRNGGVKLIHNKKTYQLYKIIDYCVKNGMNYNILLKKNMVLFLEKTSKKEFFTRKNIPIHDQTFEQYTEALERYGLLLIISRKPLKCKLLRHHLLIDILDHFKKKKAFYKKAYHSLIKEILKEIKKYKRIYKIDRILLENAEKKEEIKFIHSSLSLEGNPITLADTQKIILNELIPAQYRINDIQEVTNYKKAIDYMIENAKKKVNLTLELIQEYHKLAMNHMDGAGEIRKQNVIIKGNPHFKTAEWNLLPKMLNDIMKRYQTFVIKKKKTGEIIHFAAFFHNEFQRIHPFIDGNSRISRLLMLHILRSYNLPVLDLPLGYFDEYLDLTKRSKKRDDETFKYLVEEIVLFNLKKANRHA